MSAFNRRELLLKGTSAAAATAAYALRGPARTLLEGTARAQAAPAWNHDPGSLIGPSHWAEIAPGFSACGTGMRQSPVDIETARVGVLRSRPLLLRYEASELGIENTGHVIEVPIPRGVEDVLLIGGDRYRLVQYHFHAPSEHTVNGRYADVEGHFVHANAAGEIAVVGVFYRIGPRPNPLLETILLKAPERSGRHGQPIGEANPADLFGGLGGARGCQTKACEESVRERARHGRVRVEAFYAYDGSLTTPGCTENVRWSVLSEGGHVSRAAVTRFHAVIAKFANYWGYANNRCSSRVGGEPPGWAA
jgi:carbonic anhydrase